MDERRAKAARCGAGRRSGGADHLFLPL